MPRSKQNPQEPEQAPVEGAATPEVSITIEDAPILTIEESGPKAPPKPAKPVKTTELPNGIVIEDY